MLSENISFFALQFVFRKIHRAILFAFFILLGTAIAYSVLQKEASYGLTPFSLNALKTNSLRVYEGIDDTLFSMQKNRSFVSTPDLSKDIIYLGQNTRPDRDEGDQELFLYIPSSGERLFIESGEKIYLTYRKKDGHKSVLAYSEEKSPLSIKPFLLSDGRVKLDIFLRFKNLEDELIITEKNAIYLDPCSSSEKLMYFRDEGKDHLAFKNLSKAQLWEPDKLFGCIGAEKYVSRQGRYRLVFWEGERSWILYLREGDRFVFDGEKWRAAQLGEDSTVLPLAMVRFISPHRMDLDIWDENGFTKMNISLNMHKSPPLNFRAEEVFSRIRRRTTQSISLKLGNKSAFLKKGDWLIREEMGWRHLRRREEIETCLNYGFSGELFVFEGVEKEGNTSWFKGFLFDAMRCTMMEVKLPLAPTKKSSSQKKTQITEKLKKALS